MIKISNVTSGPQCTGLNPISQDMTLHESSLVFISFLTMSVVCVTSPCQCYWKYYETDIYFLHVWCNIDCFTLNDVNNFLMCKSWRSRASLWNVDKKHISNVLKMKFLRKLGVVFFLYFLSISTKTTPSESSLILVFGNPVGHELKTSYPSIYIHIYYI